MLRTEKKSKARILATREFLIDLVKNSIFQHYLKPATSVDMLRAVSLETLSRTHCDVVKKQKVARAQELNLVYSMSQSTS